MRSFCFRHPTITLLILVGAFMFVSFGWFDALEGFFADPNVLDAVSAVGLFGFAWLLYSAIAEWWQRS